MKNVFVLMHDDAGQEACFQAALDLTRALGGHLTCVDIAIVPMLAGDFDGLGGAAILAADERQNEKENRVRMEGRLRTEDVPFNWVEATGFLSPTVRDTAALADVIVLNSELEGKYPDMQEVVGEVLIKSDKPVVAVPGTAAGFNAYGHALIAWDGSREAVVALQASVPLLKRASGVTLLEIDDRSIQLPAEDAAEYLSRHGIKPVIRRENAITDIPSTIILATIKDLNAAYLVMGGFGHSRFVEAAFGGVTKRMLKECPVPFFLAR